MLRIRSSIFFGMGQATGPEAKIYRELGNCGTVSSSVFGKSGRACKMYTVSELRANISKPQEFLDTQKNKKVIFYPSPTDVVTRLGLCGALHTVFQNSGLLIPWSYGVTQIEPGVFHPEKSWEQMVSESEALRENPQADAWDVCQGAWDASLATWHVPTGRSYAYVITNARGGTLCDAANPDDEVKVSWSFQLPKQYKYSPIVLATAAKWLASYSEGQPQKNRPSGAMFVYCAKTMNERKETDPIWHHSFIVKDVKQVRYGASGPEEGPVVKRVEGPIARLTFSGDAPGWTGDIFGAQVSGAMNLTPTALHKAINEGKWPPANAGKVTWTDDGTSVAPAALLPQAPPPQAPPATQSNILGYAGVGVGILFFILALTQKKEP